MLNYVKPLVRILLTSLSCVMLMLSLSLQSVFVFAIWDDLQFFLDRWTGCTRSKEVLLADLGNVDAEVIREGKIPQS